MGQSRNGTHEIHRSAFLLGSEWLSLFFSLYVLLPFKHTFSLKTIFIQIKFPIELVSFATYENQRSRSLPVTIFRPFLSFFSLPQTLSCSGQTYPQNHSMQEGISEVNSNSIYSLGKVLALLMHLKVFHHHRPQSRPLHNMHIQRKPLTG